jgi:hypothetical protein
MIVLKKKPKATKCRDYLTVYLIARAAKIVARILRRRIEKNLTTYLEKINLGLEEEKEVGMKLGC